MKLAILGGTFNPVHVGHLFLAEEVISLLHYDRVLFIPAFMPVHKERGRMAPPSHRRRMLELALQDAPHFSLDDCELRRGGPSYSVDTVREIVSAYAVEGKPGLVIGDDLAPEFHTWKEAEQLAALVDLIVARRNSGTAADIGYPCTCIENRLLPVSSSEIRDRIAAGRSIRYLVPDAVIDYIDRYGLYRRSS
jgi:nicotinate-nucleotide adenylyltransferase